MCTTGAKVLRPGLEFVLFKNRDFKRARYDDKLSVTETVFGMLGLETWDGDDPASDRFSGFSVGFNGTLACCDSNVQTVGDSLNYDRLVQAVVEGATTVDEAVAIVGGRVETGAYHWANMLVATPQEVAAIEVRDGQIAVERGQVMARANHHICLGANARDDDTLTTPVRYDLALRGMRQVQTLDDVFALTRTHAPGLGYGICNHEGMETVYSYIVHWNEGQTTLYVYQGHPCEGGAFTPVSVAFGSAVDVSAYPSSRV